jgi:hypothetical protein
MEDQGFTAWCRSATRLSADCFFGHHLRCWITWCVCTCGCVESRALSNWLATLSADELKRARAGAADELAAYFRSAARDRLGVAA